MHDPKDLTATQLARLLESMTSHPHNTGALSQLDEATLAFDRKSKQAGEAQRAFSEARHRHMRSYSTDTGRYSDEAWDVAMARAQELALALRDLGDVRIARCQRPAEWRGGPCSLPLDDDGVCRSTLGHTDG